MQKLPGRRVVDASLRPVGLLLSQRTGPDGSTLSEILLCPPEGLDSAFDAADLEGAARAALGPRGRFQRTASRLELLETAEDRFGAGLEEEELLFLLAYEGRADVRYEKALATLLTGPEDVEPKGESLRLKAPWRDFLVEASQELPPGAEGVYTAGLVEGWVHVETSREGGRLTRFTVLAPALVEVEYPGEVPVQEGDHILVAGLLKGSPEGWRLRAGSILIPSRKLHYKMRADATPA